MLRSRRLSSKVDTIDGDKIIEISIAEPPTAVREVAARDN